MKRKVIKRELIPSKSPLVFLGVLWLIFDRLNATPFWMGIYWAVFIMIMLAWVLVFINEQSVNLSELP